MYFVEYLANDGLYNTRNILDQIKMLPKTFLIHY